MSESSKWRPLDINRIVFRRGRQSGRLGGGKHRTQDRLCHWVMSPTWIDLKQCQKWRISSAWQLNGWSITTSQAPHSQQYLKTQCYLSNNDRLIHQSLLFQMFGSSLNQCLKMTQWCSLLVSVQLDFDGARAPAQESTVEMCMSHCMWCLHVCSRHVIIVCYWSFTYKWLFWKTEKEGHRLYRFCEWSINIFSVICTSTTLWKDTRAQKSPNHTYRHTNTHSLCVYFLSDQTNSLSMDLYSALLMFNSTQIMGGGHLSSLVLKKYRCQ